MTTNPPADAAKLVERLYRRANASDDDCRTDDADLFRESADLLAAQASQIEALTADKARLDWLDQVNATTNARNGTRYGWRYDINHNRAALTDHNYPPLSVREAIDDARGGRVTQLANTINDDLVREATARATAAEAKAAKMREALEGWDKLHRDMVAAGGDLHALPNGLIEKFARVQAVLVDQTRAAVDQEDRP